MDGARFYAQKDKIGSKLTTKLTPRPRTLAFPKICTAAGDLTQNPIRIMEDFQKFNSNLYDATFPSSPNMEYFLTDLPIPTIARNHRDLLEKPFSSEEVIETIKFLKLGTSPGPGGFSVGYYRKCGHALSFFMARSFSSLRDGVPLDRDLNSAYISVIPKPGKDVSEISNYHPISLINNSLKIMTKILASRLSSFIEKYVHED